MTDTHTYSQSTGIYTTPDGETHRGHSGSGDGLNNPDMQSVGGVGPIPRGTWAIDQTHTNPAHGEVVMWLKWLHGPDGETEQPNGVRGSYIHGAEPAAEHSDADSCIHLPLAVRERIARFEDEKPGHRRLVVVR